MTPPVPPIICFGQQPNGFFPKGFFVDKIFTARKLQREIGGRIIWFCHDSDHDYRETITKIKTDRYPEGFVRLNINQPTKHEKLFTPLYQKRIKKGWREETANKLQPIIPKESWELFKSIHTIQHDRHSGQSEESPTNVGSRTQEIPRQARDDNKTVGTVADFCIAMYRSMKLLEGIEIARSSDPLFRARALDISHEDHYIDIEYKGAIVHARTSPEGYFINHGGDVKEFIPSDLVPRMLRKELLSPPRTNRFAWMQIALHCTHYIYGKGEAEYLDFKAFPEVTFIPREKTRDPELAVINPSTDPG